MNIRQAKKQIEQAVNVYLRKDEYGNYKIPLEKQRPVFLVGAPGIGKTAIMEQIAQEMDIALVSYSMTHHTRQSALGLPFIVKKVYGGKQYDVSLYTMSEIIGSVYETMEQSGKKEGILFLDEINCVSETLGPSMLQFLQYKTFGNHRMPPGWVIVTAGNPPEFNRSVREFDVATLDRLKVMEVSADFEVWKLYGQKNGLHKSILSYLDIKKDDFYVIENTVDGKTYVTARGWEDLSEAIFLYEECGYTVDESLISQYLSNKRISGEFAAYYALYHKYREDYQVGDILKGTAGSAIEKRAKKASFDERMSLVGLLVEAILPKIRQNVETSRHLKELYPRLKELKESLRDTQEGAVEHFLDQLIDDTYAQMRARRAAMQLTDEERRSLQYRIHFAEVCRREFAFDAADSEKEAFERVKTVFEKRVRTMQAEADEIGMELTNMFRFISRAFGEGNEMLILVTEMTANKYSAKYISEHGCEEYYKYNKLFLLYERNQELLDEVERITQSEREEAMAL